MDLNSEKCKVSFIGIWTVVPTTKPENMKFPKLNFVLKKNGVLETRKFTWPQNNQPSLEMEWAYFLSPSRAGALMVDPKQTQACEILTTSLLQTQAFPLWKLESSNWSPLRAFFKLASLSLEPNAIASLKLGPGLWAWSQACSRSKSLKILSAKILGENFDFFLLMILLNVMFQILAAEKWLCLQTWVRSNKVFWSNFTLMLLLLRLSVRSIASSFWFAFMLGTL